MELSTTDSNSVASPLISRRQPVSRLWMLIGVMGLILVALLVTIISLGFELAENDDPVPTPSPGPQGPKNVIFMISDGFGPASETFARSFLQYKNNLPMNATLPLDTMLVGTSRTRAWETLVTDSSAGATAFSCGYKSRNAYVGLDYNQVKCETLLEAAKKIGMKTGLVATSRITHATPASFSAHNNNRDDEYGIALEQIGKVGDPLVVDLFFGGGRQYFNGTVRPDKVDLIARANERGYSFISSKDQLATVTLPALGLFSTSHMALELDRATSEAAGASATPQQANIQGEPSLPSMATRALQLLKAAVPADAQRGFFLMIEGSRIDQAAHNNDPAGHLHDILAYQNTVQLVKDFADANPNTVVISVSDHETGGLTLGAQLTGAYPEYRWFPEALATSTQSSEFLAQSISLFTSAVPAPTAQNITDFLTNTICLAGLGVTPTAAELASLEQAAANPSINAILILSKMISNRAEVGWTTEGHTGVDVNLYAYPPGAAVTEALRGNHENTELGHPVQNFLGLNWPILYPQSVSSSSSSVSPPLRRLRRDNN